MRGRLPVQQADAANAIMRDPEPVPLARRQRQAVRAAVGRLGLSSSAGDLAVVEEAVVPRHPVSPRAGLLALIAAVAGALAALVFASIREQMARPSPADSAAADAFDIDSLFEPRYGEHRGSRSDAVEQWLDEVRNREAS